MTGREEDPVDDLAAITLVGDDEAEGWLFGAMMSFAGLARSVEQGDVQLPFWDEHSLDAQRMYTVACVLYGSDPELHAGLVGTDGLPEQRAARCPAEFERLGPATRAASPLGVAHHVPGAVQMHRDGGHKEHRAGDVRHGCCIEQQ